MSEADRNLMSTSKKPLICAEWTAEIPDEDEVTLSSKFYFKSVQYQFMLGMLVMDTLYLDMVRSDEEDIDECFRCTVAVSEFDLMTPPPPPPVRKCIDPEQDILWLWEIDESDLKLARIQKKTISFLVVLEEDRASTQEQEADSDWSLNLKSLHSLSRDFAKLLDDTRSADIRLLCGDLTIPAHGTVLGVRSEVFEKMLQADMMERRTGSIEIPDIEPQIIKDFLRYLYTGALPEMTVEKASRLYEAGDKYNITSLVEECRSYLGRNLTKNNACEVLVLADYHSDSDLKTRAIDFISQLDIPLIPGIWKQFSDESPKLALEAVQIAYEFVKLNTSLN